MKYPVTPTRELTLAELRESLTDKPTEQWVSNPCAENGWECWFDGYFYTIIVKGGLRYLESIQKCREDWLRFANNRIKDGE